MIAALLFALQLGAEAPLDSPRLEERAQGLMREIRCVVCENEPVSQSTADMAVNARKLIREMVEQGKSDQDVRTFFSDRYGNYVLLRPPSGGMGILLWLFPFALLAGVAAFLGLRSFRSRHRELAPLPDDGRDNPPA
jgi:cytochrome c-type biogenesis protein CcmH